MLHLLLLAWDLSREREAQLEFSAAVRQSSFTALESFCI
jgi:hypothetical protein